MQISPINNLNFNARFIKNNALEELVYSADKNTLGRFNEIITRASKVNDKEFFKISSLNEMTHEGKEDFINYHYHLYRFPENNEYAKQMLDRVSFRVKRESDIIETVTQKRAEVLEAFLPMLEVLYPKKDYIETRKELLENIDKLLARV